MVKVWFLGQLPLDLLGYQVGWTGGRRRGGVAANCSSGINKSRGEGRRVGGGDGGCRGARRNIEGAGRRGERGRGGGGITAEAFH